MSDNKRLHVISASAGTGKTYTLAAHYVALLMSGDSYRSILAVTFTNKATAEMKQRIISYLNAIATSPLSKTDPTRIENDKVHDFLDCVRSVSGKRGLTTHTDAEYQETAKGLVPAILSDFDNMRVQTIDSFLQTLLSGLANALGQAAGFAVNLDLKKAISDAVDEVLSYDTRDNGQVKKAVIGCLQDRLAVEDKWDMRPTLIAMVNKLYSENVQIFRDKIAMSTAKHDYFEELRNYSTAVRGYELTAEYKELAGLYYKMKDYESTGKIQGGSNYYKMISRVGKSLCCKAAEAEAFKGLTSIEALCKPAFLKKFTSPAEGEDVREDLLRMHELLQNPIFRKGYFARKACCQYLSELQLLGYVIDRIRTDQRENNTFLLTETAYTLCRALYKHDALFILEKAGIRYKHIMLDEFQDTSTLQWANFKALVLELLSQGGTALIVGDVKQSIYRWRNGDYEIMQNLNMDPDLNTYYAKGQLKRNFRSRKAIVEFNAETFKQLSKNEGGVVESMYDEKYESAKLNEFYKASNTDGYVCLRSFTPAYKVKKGAEEATDSAETEAKDQPVLTKAQQNELARRAMLDYMFERMEDLLNCGYEKKHMLILSRGKTDTERIIQHFNNLITDSVRFPNLAAAGKIVSRDSFLLSSSTAVQTIISALSYIARHDGVGLQFLKTNYPDVDVTEALKGLHCGLPLNVLIDRITSALLCTTEIPAKDSTEVSVKVYAGDDLAHLNCFRDKVRAFVCSHGSDVKDFLRNWDDYMSEDTIPAGESNDITLMTIHSAKGLEAKNVFVPFCGWALEESAQKAATMWCEVADFVPNDKVMMPVTYSKQTEVAFPEMHRKEQQQERIDVLNLLYVACTRAEDNLFVLVYDNDDNTAGALLTRLYDVEPNGMVEWDGRGKFVDDPAAAQPKPMMQRMVKKAEEEDIPKPFSFEKSDTINATYSASGAGIEFRQSQKARDVMLELAAEPVEDETADLKKQSEYMRFGTICHSILEHIRVKADVEHAIDDMAMRGQISTKQKENVNQLIMRLMNHPIAGTWFTDKWTLLREDTVFTPNPDGTVDEIRMDRVMISQDNPEQAVVLDYKFAHPDPEHNEQVHKYMEAIRRMGYSDVRGYLWYAFHNNLAEVK